MEGESSSNNWSKSVCKFVGNFKEKIKIKLQNVFEKKISPLKYLKGVIFCILIITAPCPVDTIYLKPKYNNLTKNGMMPKSFLEVLKGFYSNYILLIIKGFKNFMFYFAKNMC